MWKEAKYYSGMARGIWSYSATTPPQNPLELFRNGVRNRESAFLHLAREAGYAFPDSSLAQLLRLARCEYADLESMVRTRGLEPTLRALCDAGVYVTHDEFKGRVPLVRHGVEIPGGEARFRNPLVKGGIESRSSGSRSGGGTSTPKVEKHQVYHEIHEWLLEKEHELNPAEWVQLRPILPSFTGLGASMRASRRGNPIRRWFTPPSSIAQEWHYRAATTAMVALARLRGMKVPFPTQLPDNDFAPVARYIANRRCVVQSFASPAVRVADAALTLGLNISGTTFICGGEATSPAKRDIVRRAGARMVTRYHISEIGLIGFACRHMEANDVHVVTSSVAVIARRRPVPLNPEIEVDSLAFTTLLPFSSRFLINAEMDDTGVLEDVPGCQCSFGALGMTTVIRNIASYGKLTGQGMTLFGADILAILEKAMPSRFGGAPGDYQLVERDLGTQTGLELRVSPRIHTGQQDSSALKDFFLEQLKMRYGGRLAARVWTHTKAIQVVREEPLTTQTGKVLPLALSGPSHRKA